MHQSTHPDPTGLFLLSKIRETAVSTDWPGHLATEVVKALQKPLPLTYLACFTLGCSYLPFNTALYVGNGRVHRFQKPFSVYWNRLPVNIIHSPNPQACLVIGRRYISDLESMYEEMTTQLPSLQVNNTHIRNN